MCGSQRCRSEGWLWTDCYPIELDGLTTISRSGAWLSALLQYSICSIKISEDCSIKLRILKRWSPKYTCVCYWGHRPHVLFFIDQRLERVLACRVFHKWNWIHVDRVWSGAVIVSMALNVLHCSRMRFLVDSPWESCSVFIVMDCIQYRYFGSTFPQRVLTSFELTQLYWFPK